MLTFFEFMQKKNENAQFDATGRPILPNVGAGQIQPPLMDKNGLVGRKFDANGRPILPNVGAGQIQPPMGKNFDPTGRPILPNVGAGQIQPPLMDKNGLVGRKVDANGRPIPVFGGR